MSDQSEIARRLDVALKATEAAADLIMPHYQSADLAVESKGDQSPVTVADKGAEKLIREQLFDAFPDDSLLGEEFDDVHGTSGFRWIIDPIDGTKSFIHGVPLFGTLAGLEYDGHLVAGVCRFPALNEVVYASAGQGAWWQRPTAGRRAGQRDVRIVASPVLPNHDHALGTDWPDGSVPRPVLQVEIDPRLGGLLRTHSRRHRPRRSDGRSRAECLGLCGPDSDFGRSGR